MKITLTGASGLIGTALLERLRERGAELWVLGRKPVAGLRFSQWDTTTQPPEESLSGADAVINLSGEPVAQRWTPEAKLRIRDSRINGTRQLVHALSTQARRPQVLISGSAVGIYGSRGDEILTEQSGSGKGFLADLADAWESEADGARALGMRVVKLRTGVVLAKHGGALQPMLTPFRIGVGGRLASGEQWMPWIHLDDIVGLILFALDQTGVSGAVNGSAPNPVTNREFTAELGKALHRPAILPVPKFALQLLFGEMAEVVLASERAIPAAAERSGYKFQYPLLGPALAQILGES